MSEFQGYYDLSPKSEVSNAEHEARLACDASGLTAAQRDWLKANPKFVETRNGVGYRTIGAVSPDGRFQEIKMRHPILLRRGIDWVGVGIPLSR